MMAAPKIRFKGFSGDWEQRKLREVAEVVGGGTPDTTNLEYWNGDIDWYSPTEIGKDIYAFNSQRKITELGLKKSSARILPADKTILFTSRAGIGDMAILKKTAATNQGFQSLIVSENYDVYFLYSTGNKIKEYALKNASGSTFLEISGKCLSKMELYVPLSPEQTAIGHFFRTLDDSITLHKRRLDGLKELKYGYLKQMFPQASESVPRVRFAEFSGDWVEKKLGEVLIERKLRQKITDEFPLLAFAAGQGVIDRSERKTNNRDFLTHDSSTKTYLLTHKDDIVYNPSNLKYGAIDRNKYGSGVISPIYVTFETTEIPSFIELIVTSKSFKDTALQYEEGTVTKRQSVKPEFLLTLDIKMTTNKGEQTAIGNFFRNLDEQIAVQQTKLFKLKQLKAAYLQRMFV